MERSVKLQSHSVKSLLQFAKLYFLLGQPAKAIPVLQEVLEKDPRSSGGACGLARARLAIGKREMALQDLQAHLLRNPSDGNARKLLNSLMGE